MSGTWSAPASWDTVSRRAAGRRHYNAARKHHKQWRRAQILSRTAGLPRDTWGLQAALARVLGVSRATVCRDFKAIRDAHHGALLEQRDNAEADDEPGLWWKQI